MINDAQYKIGVQPCGHFDPSEEGAAGTGGNVHSCRGCDGTVSFCTNCLTDHHSGGWQVCTKRICRDISRTALRMGLSQLTTFLDMLDDWALQAELPGVRRVLYDQRREIWNILDWLGTPFANTNSNSNSKEQRSSRITNSSSKQGESDPVSPQESTNTKFEEQTP